MQKSLRSLLTVATVTLALLAGACGGGKATTSASPPPTTPPTTTATTPPSTTTTPPTTTTGGGTLPTTAIAITTHDATTLTMYGVGTAAGLCQMCHGQGTSNSNPYPPTWDGKANGSTKNTGVYTITPGSPQDHSQYTVAQCTQAGCHAAPGGATTTPPASTTTTPPVSTTTTPPASTTTAPRLVFVEIWPDGFHPDTLAIKVGAAVTFTNNEETTSDLICDALEIDQAIPRTLTFTYSFNVAGVYTFKTGEGASLKITVT